MGKFCSSCGAPLQNNPKFCSCCGIQTAAAGAMNGNAAPMEQDRLASPPIYQSQFPPPQAVPFYPQQPQQPFPQPCGPMPEAKAKAKKKRMGLKIALGILGGFVAFIALIMVIALAATGRATKLDYYEIGKDKIPSVKLVLGEERRVTSTATRTSNGVTIKEYQYEVHAEQNEDMDKYARYLLSQDDFYRLEDENQNAFATIGRNSVDKGHCLTVEILVEESGCTITILKEQGHITPNGQDEPTTKPDDPVEPTTTPDQYDPDDYPEDILADPDLSGQPWMGIWQFIGTNTENIYLNKDGTFQVDIYHGDGSEDRSITGNYYIEAGRISLYDAFENGVQISDIEMTFRMPDEYIAIIDGNKYERIVEDGD